MTSPRQGGPVHPAGPPFIRPEPGLVGRSPGTRHLRVGLSLPAAYRHGVPATSVIIFRISHTKADTGVVRIAKSEGGLVLIFDAGEFRDLVNQREGIHGYKKYKSAPAGCDTGIACCGCYKGTHKLHNVITNGLGGM